MTALSNLCPASLPAAADEADEAEEAAAEGEKKDGAEKEQDVKVSSTQHTAHSKRLCPLTQHTK